MLGSYLSPLVEGLLRVGLVVGGGLREVTLLVETLELVESWEGSYLFRPE